MTKKSWGHFYLHEPDLKYLIKNTFFHLPMFELIYKENPKKILEIGSGSGTMAIFLSYLGFDVISLDNDKKILFDAKRVTKKFNGRVKFTFGNAFKLPFREKSFDVIFHQGLFEHFLDEDIFRLLDEQLRVAKIVVFSVPNNYYPKKDFGNERLLSKKYWDRLIRLRYKLLESQNYHSFPQAVFGGRFIYRTKNTMYLAKVTK